MRDSPIVAVPIDRRESRSAALVAVALCALWVAHAAFRGALGIARNDDWDAYNIAYRFAAHGGFEPSGWLWMVLIGQVLLAWPLIAAFGATIAPVQLAVAGLAAVGLWGAYVLIRAFLPRRWAIFAVACVALGPIYGSLAVSFMTDGPAFTGQVLTLLAGARAWRDGRVSVRWFAVALIVAFAAFAIREHTAPAGAAVVFVSLWRAARRDRLRLAALTLVWLVALVMLYKWRMSLPNDVARRVGWLLRTSHGLYVYSRRAGFDLGIFVVPAVLALSPLRLGREIVRTTRVAAIAVLVLSGVWLYLGWFKDVFLGNYLTVTGSYTGVIPGPAPAVVAKPLWILIEILGGVGWVVIMTMVAVAWRRPRAEVSVSFQSSSRWIDRPQSLLAIFILMTIGEHLTMLLLTVAPMWDRYLIPMVPFTAALVVSVGLERDLITSTSRLTGALALAGWALLGGTYVDASATFDGARWRLAERLVSMGYAPETVDGGLEWFGYYHPSKVDLKAPRAYQNFWVDMVRHGPVCATISFAPLGRLGAAPLAESRARALSVEYLLLARAGPDSSCPDRR